MYKILLIGAGELGSRHLQGLAKLKQNNILIDVIDPFEQSLEIAKKRYTEIQNTNQKVEYFLSIDDIQTSKYDLVIVATNSDIRAMVVKDLILKKEVDNLLLEKVLFQKEDDYHEMKSLFEKHNINVWVNHPRRMFPLYQQLKLILKNASKINFSVSGGAWGLACNGLHFLDCFQYLSNTKDDVEIETKYLNKEVTETKRKGFLEVNGKIVGSLGKNTFDINCFALPSPILISITSDIVNIVIDEANGKYTMYEAKDNWKENPIKDKIVYYQSELTNIAVENIMEGNSCSLPSYDEAMSLHLVFIDAIMKHINSVSDDTFDYCPIT